MKKILLITLLFTFMPIHSQKLPIRSGIGFAGYGNPFDGYFFSTEIGIPIIKSIELTPTMTFYSKIKDNEFFYLREQNIATTSILNKKFGIITGSFEFFLNVNPFKWFLSEKINKIDFGLGFGYGIKSFSRYSYSFENNYTLIKTKAGISSIISAKVFYNYHFKKYFIGAVFGIKELRDDGASIFGLLFGLNI